MAIMRYEPVGLGQLQQQINRLFSGWDDTESSAATAGWVLTEMGRQPFVVAPNPTPGGIDGVYMFTAAAVSPGVTAGELLFSAITLTLVYLALLVVEVYLLVRFVRGGVVSAMPELAAKDDDHSDDDHTTHHSPEPARHPGHRVPGLHRLRRRAIRRADP